MEEAFLNNINKIFALLIINRVEETQVPSQHWLATLFSTVIIRCPDGNFAVLFTRPTQIPWKYSNIYIQQDATLHSLFYLETVLHISGGTTTHHQERKQLYLEHLVFVTPLLLSAAIVEELELV